MKYRIIEHATRLFDGVPGHIIDIQPPVSSRRANAAIKALQALGLTAEAGIRHNDYPKRDGLTTLHVRAGERPAGPPVEVDAPPLTPHYTFAEIADSLGATLVQQSARRAA